MELPEVGQQLRIYLGEDDTFKGKPLYEAIVLKARELNLAGITVLRGIMGFGANSRIHTKKILRLSQDLPIIIDIVDTSENIEKIMPFLHETVKERLITSKAIKIVKYIHNHK